MFDFNVKPSSYMDNNMILINGRIPDEKIEVPIILITCSRRQEERLKEFIKNENGAVYVFEDKASMYNFRRLLFGSEEYLDSNFELRSIEYIAKSTKNKIKYLKYIIGIENFIDKDRVLSFINKSYQLEILKKLDKYGVENIWIMKDEEDKIDIEGFYYK